MIKTYTIIGTATTGGAGASGSTTTTAYVVSGRVISVGVTGQGSPPATTDITIRGAATTMGAKAPILIITNYSADGVYYPHNLKDDSAGADIAANYVEPVVHDQIEVVVAQANDGDSVDVVLVVEC